MAPNQKVLIVDDNPDILEVLSEFFIDQGYEVKLANSSLEALSMIEEQVYGIILCDIIMGKLNGDKLVNLIYSKSPFSKIILMSGTVEYQQKVEDRCTFIPKPIDYKKLLEIIE